jgi:hypothetical protein
LMLEWSADQFTAVGEWQMPRNSNDAFVRHVYSTVAHTYKYGCTQIRVDLFPGSLR